MTMLGKHHSPESREKIRLSNIGKNLGKPGPNLNHPCKESTKQLLREINLGKQAPNKGISNTDFYGTEKAAEMQQKQTENGTNGANRIGISDIEFYGEEKAKEISKKISIAVKISNAEYWEDLRRKNPNGWQDCRWDIWSKGVKERDNYVCQGPGPHKGKLAAHHIKDWNNFPQLRFVIENGIALCSSCHGREHARIDGQVRVAFQKALYLIRYIETFCVCNSLTHANDCAIGQLASILKEATTIPDRGETVNPILINACYKLENIKEDLKKEEVEQ